LIAAIKRARKRAKERKAGWQSDAAFASDDGLLGNWLSLPLDWIGSGGVARDISAIETRLTSSYA
jgi:hypothetical protein